MRAYFEDREKISINKERLEAFPLEAVIKRGDFRAHWHNEIELVLVLNGNLLMGINAESKVLNIGDIAVSNSGDVHYFESMSDETKILIIVFKPTVLDGLLSLLNFTLATPFITKSDLHRLNIPDAIFEKLRGLMIAVLQEMTNRTLHYEFVVKGHLVEFFGLLLRYVPYETDDSKNSIIGHKSKELVQSAIFYIEENYSENISLLSLANHLGISKYYLSRLFNRLTGQAFRTYLNNIRLDKAQKLLYSTDKSIIDIAFECGFNSLRTFNRVYKENKGVVPSDYR